MPTIDETVEFIRRAHGEQATKAGEPYWTHPVAVMGLLPVHATDDERHAALLHDVLEDTDTTEGDLRAAGYSERTIALVRMLSRPEGDARPSYMDWIRTIAATGDRGLIAIKLADNMHNSDPERIAKLPAEERGIVDRYRRSMRILTDALAVAQ